MKAVITPLYCTIVLLLLTVTGHSATVNWSAGIDHGFSLADGSALPAGSLVRLGWFRDTGTGVQLTDSQIQALAGSTALLEASFVEAATTTVGAGLSGIPSHFSAASAVNTASLGIVGKQAYLWVLNAATTASATQQSILYWSTSDATNPDGTPTRPGIRWAFPAELPIPGTTSFDLTDLTSGTTTLGTGAHLVVGSFPRGTSANTSAPNFALTPISSVLQINTASPLATGVRSTNYSQVLIATGGTLPLTWSINSGALPAGLELDPSTGEIFGSPTAVGVSTFIVQVNDSGGLVSSKQYNLQVTNSALAILTTAVADALVDQDYNFTLHADGGVAPYTWSVTTGTLPLGITLGTDGILSGVATTPGSHTFQVTALDQSNQASVRTLTLATTYTPTIEGDSTLVPGVRQLLYTRQFIIPDGRPYSWAVTGGALPPGLTLSTAGLLRGICPTAGTYSFTITASGAATASATRQFTLTILPANLKPTLQTPAFPDTIVGNNNYRYQVVASPRPVTVYISGLPPGLKLDPSTGWVTGNPTKAGVYVAAVRATNAAGSSALEYATIKVKALPAGAVGTFNAIVAPVQEVNGLLGGRIDVTTSITGSYSLTLTQGTATVRNTGILTTQLASLSPRIVTRIGNLMLNLVFDSSNDNLVGSISAITANGSLVPASVTGWRQTWNTQNPTEHHTGRYSAGVDLTSHIDIETVPQGTGWLTASVSTLGTVAFAGRTAAGDMVTSSSSVSNNNRLLVYSRLNGNLGVVQGVLNLGLSPSGISSNTLTGTLTWRKSTTPTTIYPTAFGPINVAVTGSYLSSIYSYNVHWGSVLGLPATAVPSSLTFSKGGLAGASINPSISPFTFSSSYVRDIHYRTAHLPTPGSTFNPARTTLTVIPRSGAVNGGFTLQDGTRRRTAGYSGMIVRTPDGSLKAVGYFLLPKLLQFGEAGPAQVLSGKFTLTQP